MNCWYLNDFCYSSMQFTLVVDHNLNNVSSYSLYFSQSCYGNKRYFTGQLS